LHVGKICVTDITHRLQPVFSSCPLVYFSTPPRVTFVGVCVSLLVRVTLTPNRHTHT